MKAKSMGDLTLDIFADEESFNSHRLYIDTNLKPGEVIARVVAGGIVKVTYDSPEEAAKENPNKPIFNVVITRIK